MPEPKRRGLEELLIALGATADSGEPCPSSERIALHRDGELDPAAERAVVEHLRGCALCAEQLALFSWPVGQRISIPDELAHIARRAVEALVQTLGRPADRELVFAVAAARGKDGPREDWDRSFWACFLTGDYVGALVALDRRIVRDEEQAIEVEECRALCKAALGDHASARELLELRATGERREQGTWSDLLRGQVLLALGEVDDAVEALEAVRGKFRAQAERMLRSLRERGVIPGRPEK